MNHLRFYCFRLVNCIRLMLVVFLCIGSAPYVSVADEKDISGEGITELLSLAQKIRLEGSQIDKAALVDSLENDFLNSSSNTKLMAPVEWLELAYCLEKHLDANTQQTIVSALRQAYWIDAGMRANLAADDFIVLMDACSFLNDTSLRNDAASAFIADPSKVSSLSVKRLASASYHMRALESQGKDARLLLARHITANVVSDADVLRSVPASQWKNIAWNLRDALDESQRALWVGNLQKYRDSNDLSLKELIDLHDLEKILEFSSNSYAKLTAVVEDKSAVDTLSAAELDRLAYHLYRAGEQAFSARRCLADSIANRGEQFLAEVPLVTLSKTFFNLGKVFDGQQAAAIAEMLKTIYRDKPLGFADAYAYNRILFSLHDHSGVQFLAESITKSNDWQQLRGSEMHFLISALKSRRLIQDSCLSKIADFLISPDCKLITEDFQAYEESIWLLSDILNESQKNALQGTLKSTYGIAQTSASKKDINSYARSVLLQHAMGFDSAKSLALDLIEASGTSESMDRHMQFRLLPLILQSGDNASSARFMQSLYDNFIADPEANKDTLVADEALLASKYASALPVETRKKWLQSFIDRRSLADSQRAAMSAYEALFSINTVTKLGYPDADLSAIDICNKQSDWVYLEPAMLRDFTVQLMYSGQLGLEARTRAASMIYTNSLRPEKIKQFTLSQIAAMTGALVDAMTYEDRVRWSEAVNAAYVQDAETYQQLKYDDIHDLAEIFAKLGFKQKARTHSRELLNRFRDINAPDFHQLYLVSEALYGTGLTDNGLAYMDIAEALISLAKSKKLEATPVQLMVFGAVIQSKSARGLLMQNLVAGDYAPNEFLAGCLSYSYSTEDDIAKWQQYILTAAAQSDEDELKDAHSAWLLIYHDCLLANSHGEEIADENLRLAASVAISDSQKLHCLKAAVRYYLYAGQLDKIDTLFDDAAGWNLSISTQQELEKYKQQVVLDRRNQAISLYRDCRNQLPLSRDNSPMVNLAASKVSAESTTDDTQSNMEYYAKYID